MRFATPRTLFAAEGDDNQMTEWRSVVGFEGLYEVSDEGQVRSLPRQIVGKTKRGESCVRPWRGKILKPDVNRVSGHQGVTLYGERVRRVLVHHLVLEAFVSPRPLGLEGCHWDDDPSNNHVSNLRWGTRSENKFDSVRNGRHPQANKTHCPRGHELTPDPYKPGARWCHPCKKEASRRYEENRRGARTT